MTFIVSFFIFDTFRHSPILPGEACPHCVPTAPGNGVALFRGAFRTGEERSLLKAQVLLIQVQVVFPRKVNHPRPHQYRKELMV
jgi:hypothetical protein